MIYPDNERRAWKTLLARSDHYWALMTLGFQIYIDPERAISTTNHFLTRVNRALFGKHFGAHRQWLSGLAVMERKRLSLLAAGSPHIHMLVRRPHAVPVRISDLRLVAEKQAGRLRYPIHDPNRPMGRLVSGPRFVDVRHITDLGGLADYLTKKIESLDAVNIGFFGPEGIEGITY